MRSSGKYDLAESVHLVRFDLKAEDGESALNVHAHSELAQSAT
ncbi:Uncharacterised protein [Vibrio cholerae]|nr:Uncharacterised protein [Vibrio cholerae]